MYVIPARLEAIKAEAFRLAPHRRMTSDGTVGDPAHFAKGGDHVPQADPGTTGPLIVHAVDISQSMPGTAYFTPGYQQFDVWALTERLVADYQRATPTVRAARWPWLAPPSGGYIVWGRLSAGFDVIFNPSHPAGPVVRRNVGTGREHIDSPHSHFSIGHNARSENDTQPIFGAPAPRWEDDEMLSPEAVEQVENAMKKAIREEFWDEDKGKHVDRLLLDRLRILVKR